MTRFGAWFWRSVVGVLGIDGALRIGTWFDSIATRAPTPARHRRVPQRKQQGESTVPAASNNTKRTPRRRATEAAPTSQLVATTGGVTTIYPSPKPLHPRAIEGNELRVRPPVPFAGVDDLVALMALDARQYAKRGWDRPS